MAIFCNAKISDSLSLYAVLETKCDIIDVTLCHDIHGEKMVSSFAEIRKKIIKLSQRSYTLLLIDRPEELRIPNDESTALMIKGRWMDNRWTVQSVRHPTYTRNDQLLVLLAGETINTYASPNGQHFFTNDQIIRFMETHADEKTSTDFRDHALAQGWTPDMCEHAENEAYGRPSVPERWLGVGTALAVKKL